MLRTLQNAATVVNEKFSTVTAWGALEHCIKLMIEAALEEAAQAHASAAQVARRYG
jgi:hypothetical protein